MKNILIVIIIGALIPLFPKAILAQSVEREVDKYINIIRSNPDVIAKQEAMNALAEIGLPSVDPLIDCLKQVTRSKN